MIFEAGTTTENCLMTSWAVFNPSTAYWGEMIYTESTRTVQIQYYTDDGYTSPAGGYSGGDGICTEVIPTSVEDLRYLAFGSVWGNSNELSGAEFDDIELTYTGITTTTSTSTPSNQLDGALDELATFDVALNPDEIYNAYQRGAESFALVGTVA